MTNDMRLSVEQLGDFVQCPTRYKFEHETALSGEQDKSDERRVNLLRTVLCESLQQAIQDDVDIVDMATEVLDNYWGRYADAAEHHSPHQHRYDRLMLNRGVVDTCEKHIDRSEVKAARDVLDQPVVGPDLTLDVELDGGRQYRVTVDYLRVADGQLDAVCLTDSMWRIGLPYPGMDVFEKHFEEGQFRPSGVTRVFENYLTEEWLATATGDTPYEPGSLYYASLLEDHNRAGDAVQVESEWRTIRTHYDCSDSDIRDRLRTVTSHIEEAVFDPTVFFEAEGFDSHSFEDIAERECDDCAYRTGCEQRIQQEVRFNE